MIERNETTAFGFWVYLMTDCVLFATLFATYAVLRLHTAGGPGASELFSLPMALAETLILLTSSLTSGLAFLAVVNGRTRIGLWFLGITGILGALFLGLELKEFAQLAAEGNSWQRSAFTSAFFTLVATHGLHISAGLIWISVAGYQLAHRGATNSIVRRLSLFTTFWHFLDLVWIFIFSIVYLLGALT